MRENFSRSQRKQRIKNKKGKDRRKRIDRGKTNQFKKKKEKKFLVSYFLIFSLLSLFFSLMTDREKDNRTFFNYVLKIQFIQVFRKLMLQASNKNQYQSSKPNS